MSETAYTQGICEDGAAILRDGQPMTIEEILDSLRGRDQLQAEVERLQHLLLEKFTEWQIDSGDWNEVEWLERVQVALFGRAQPEEQANEA